MAITLSPAQQALFDSTVVVPAFLIKLDTTPTPLYLTNWPLSITAFSQTFQGLGNFGEVGALRESLDGSEEKISLTLSAVNSSQVSLFLGQVDAYQDREVKIWLMMLDKDTLQPSGVPMLRFAGLMDQIGIKVGEKEAKITLDCRTGGYASRKNPTTLRLNNVQHQAKYPGEYGFGFVQNLIEQPQVWLSRTFQASQVRSN
jgi:hypothetical protein